MMVLEVDEKEEQMVTTGMVNAFSFTVNYELVHYKL